MRFDFISHLKHREIALFILLLALSSFLRFSGLPGQMPLIGDQAKDYLVARDMVLEGKVPLLGIESSQPQFRQGPLYIWLLALHFSLFGFNPEYTGYLAASIGIFAVGLLYIYSRRYFGRKTAFYATALVAVSPMAVAQSQMAFIINPIPLVSTFYLYALISYTKQKSMSLFWPAVWFGLLFQFELASAPLILLLPLAYLIKPPAKKSPTLLSLLKGLALGLLPQIVYDLSHRFAHLGLFIAWVGYRFLAFFGFQSQMAFSFNRFQTTYSTIGKYLQSITSPDKTTFLLLMIVMIFGLIIWFKLPKRSASPSTLVWSWLIILLLSYTVHGAPSEAYFPALILPVALAIGWTLSQVNSSAAIMLSPALIGIVLLVNTNRLINNPSTAWLPRLSAQQQVIDLIKTHTSGPIFLRSLGPGSQFPAFLDNFRYLAWYNQLELSHTGEPVWLIFGEQADHPPFINMRSYRLDDLTVALPL